MGIIKTMGKGPKKMETYRTNLSRTFNKILDLVPWIGEQLYTQIWIWYFPNIFDIYDYVGKLPWEHFNLWLLSNPGEIFLFFMKFNEARISEWNLGNIIIS